MNHKYLREGTSLAHFEFQILSYRFRAIIFQTWYSMIFTAIYSNLIAQTLMKHLSNVNQWFCKCVQTESMLYLRAISQYSLTICLKDSNSKWLLLNISDLLGEIRSHPGLASLERVSSLPFLLKSKFYYLIICEEDSKLKWNWSSICTSIDLCCVSIISFVWNFSTEILQ